MTALKDWTPSALELLTSAGLTDDGSRPQADELQRRGSDLQGLAFPELFFGPAARQNENNSRLQAQPAPSSITQANHLHEQLWVSELNTVDHSLSSCCLRSSADSGIHYI